MKCSICGTESKADARQCANCGASLVVPTAEQTMLDLRTAMFRRPPIAPASPGAPPAAPSSAPPSPGTEAPARSNFGGIALVMVALGTIGYFIYLLAITYDAPSRPSVPGLQNRSAKPAESAQPTPVPPAVAPSSTDIAAPSKAADAPTVTMAPPPSALEPPKPVAPPAPDPAPVAVAVSPTGSAREPPGADRWQQMSDARADCARENLIGRIVCEQRVLFQYCNGYWGKVPQCPEANNPDRGK